jgi:hypothetical protein
MSGGTIAENTAAHGSGAAIGGTLALSGRVSVGEVYLLNDTAAISITGDLIASGPVAVIDMPNYSRAAAALTGSVINNLTRFTLVSLEYKIKRNGCIVRPMYTRYRSSAIVDYYATLPEVFNDTTFPEGGNVNSPDEIRISGSAYSLGLNEGFTILSGTHVRLVPPAEGFTFTRTALSDKPVFTVANGAFLTIGGENYNDLYLDGGIINSLTNSSPLVKVENGGTFTMRINATLRNNINSGNGGAVSVDGGTFSMSGGMIGGNTANQGGGVYVGGGTFTMSGGTITGNTASNQGLGVYLGGGTFTMSGGGIVGNSGEGDQVYPVPTSL